MSDDEDNIYQSPINSLHSNAFDPGQLDYRQMIALNGQNGHGVFDYSRYRQMYKGGADPTESRSSATDRAIGIALGNEDEDENDNTVPIPYETRPDLTVTYILDEANKIFDKAVGQTKLGEETRLAILGEIQSGQIFNATNWLIKDINARFDATSQNIDPEDEPYNANDITNAIFEGSAVSNELVNGIKNKINKKYKNLLSSIVTYLYLAIIGPIDSVNTRNNVADKNMYNVNELNESFKILSKPIPVSENVYGDPLKVANETDTSGLETDTSRRSKSKGTTRIGPTNADRVFDLITKIVKDLGWSVDFINDALNNRSKAKNNPYASLKKILRNKILETEEGKRLTPTAINTALDEIFFKDGKPVKNIANQIIDMIRDVNPVGRPPINTRIDDNIDPETTKVILDKVVADREKQMEDAKKVEEDLKANPPAVPYEGLKPIKLESKKLDMSKFSAIVSILSPEAKDKARERNTEAMTKLSGDKQDAKAALEAFFISKQSSPELTEIIKIPKAPPLTMPQLQQATQATSSKAAALSTSSGYQQTPKDSLITTMTVIKLLQPIVKDSDVLTRLAAAEALLMAKAYDNNSMNAIDNYIKRAIDDKLNALKGYSSAYTNAESDLLEAMKQVLDNKSNPDNPSKLFRYSTYMKSNKSVPLKETIRDVHSKTKLSSDKVNYLKSIDLGVKSLNLKKTTKQSVKKSKTTIRDVHSKKAEPKVTKAVTKKLVKTNIQKQKDRNVKIRAAMAKLRSRQSPEGDNTEVQSEAYINKLASEAKIEAERIKQQSE